MGQLIKQDVDGVGLTYAYGVIAILVFCVGSLANGVTLAYFLSKSKKGDVANLLYEHITLIDLLLCILVLPVGASFLGQSTSWLSDHTVCNVWGMFWNLSNQMSIFLILTFNFCRTKALLFPFARTSIIGVKGGISCYLFLMVVQVCFPYFFKSSYVLNSEFLICHWDYEGLFGKGTGMFWLIFGLFNILERVLPFMAVLVSCCISYVLLVGQKRAELEELDVQGADRKMQWWEKLFCKQRAINNLNKVRFRQPPDRLKVRANHTILIATVNYAILNLPNVIYMILAFIDVQQRREPSLLAFDTKNYFVTFSLVMCAGLHALTTPLIWYARMSGLRKFYKRILRKVASLIPYLKMTDGRAVFSMRTSNSNTMTNGISSGVIANPAAGTITVSTAVGTDRGSLTEQRLSTALPPFSVPGSCPDEHEE